jgi:hypothetical protein
MNPTTTEAGAVADVAAIAGPNSLLGRAPKDLKLQWQGGFEKDWTIRIEATIVGSDQAEAVREILRVLSAASDENHLTSQGATAS